MRKRMFCIMAMALCVVSLLAGCGGTAYGAGTDRYGDNYGSG